MLNNINLYFIFKKGQFFFGHIPLNCLFDLVLFDVRYCQQISYKYGKHTGNGNWKCKGRDRKEEKKIDIENDSSYLTAC